MNEIQPYTSVHLSIFDRVEMDGGAFRVKPTRNGKGYVFTEIRGAGAVDTYSYAEIARFIRRRAMVVKKDHYTEKESSRRKKKLLDPDIIPEYIKFRARMITQFLEEEKRGQRVRSDESILEFYDEYISKYEEFVPKPRGGQKKLIVETHHPCTPRHFMRLVNRFEEDERSPFSLMYCGDPSDAKPPKRKLSKRTNEFLDAEARKLATAKRIDVALHWELMKAANRTNPNPVPLPHIRTFYRRVAEMKKMFIDLGQQGPEATRNEYELSKTANRKYHPLERIEMDEDKLDIILLLQKTRLWNVLHPDVQEKLLLRKDRFWASMAIDCGTRSILALRLLDSDPNGRSGVATLHMAVMPKDDFAKAAGTESMWIQHGIPQEVATDHGNAYLDGEFHEAVLALCGSHLMPPTGNPKLRGRIERFFRTGKKWLRLFSGQTFSNPLVRAGYDSVANASMDFEELGRCLVRLIVDAYHLTQHRGLGGQKPIDAWATMTKLRPVDVLVDPKREGLIFGFRAGTRKISRSGVICLGIPYYSPQVQELYKHFKNQEIVIKVNPYNLGLLGFRSVGDHAFHWVKAAVKGFDGVSAIEWVATKRLLDEAYSQHDIEDEAIIGRALTQILGTAKFSEDKHQVSSHVLTEADYTHFEKEFFAGYVAGRSPTPDYNPDPEQFLIDGLLDGGEDSPDESDGTAAIERDYDDDDAGDAGSILGPSAGRFDPDEFAKRRAADGVAPPLSTPPPTRPTKPRKKKEVPSPTITVSDLLRSTHDHLPAPRKDTRRTAGRTQTFKSEWDDEE